MSRTMLQVIQGGAMRAPVQGLSDRARSDELKAQQLVIPAVAALRSALQDAILLSSAMPEQLKELADMLEDNAPSLEQWDDKLHQLEEAEWTGSYYARIL